MCERGVAARYEIDKPVKAGEVRLLEGVPEQVDERLPGKPVQVVPQENAAVVIVGVHTALGPRILQCVE